MSLQVWLPFTDGTLKQQGLSSAIVTSSNYTVNNNGKLGKCIKTKNATGLDLGYDGNQINTGSISFGGWFKFNKDEIGEVINNARTYNSTYNTPTGQLIGNDSYGGIGIVWNSNNMYTSSPFSSLLICSNIRTSTVNRTTGSYTVVFDTWVHIFVTFNKDTGALTLYINGSKFSETVFSSFSDARSYNLMLNYAGVYGGNGPRLYIPFDCNDIRVYDHCLSPMEVKRISQGLVLHYPLSDNNLESTINIFSTANNDSGIAVDCMSTTMTGYRPNQNVTLSLDTMLNGLPCIRCDTEQTSSSPGIELAYNWQVEQNTDYTFSAWVESNCTAQLAAYRIKGSTYKKYTTPEFVSVTFNSGNNTVIRFFLFIIASSTVSGQYAKISHPQLEAKNHATGFTASERLNPIVYDTSGYLRNGIINGVLEIKEDTPKYKLSTYFDNDTSDTTHPSQKIYITNEDIGLKSMSQFTIAGWFKQIEFNRGGKITTSAPTSTNDYYITSGVDDYDAQIHFRTTDNSVVTISGYYNRTNEWNHIVFTFDGTNAKEYLNGELKETKSFSSAKTIDISHVTIGASNAGGVSRCYKGYVSDYRIYATALSADDVKSLYQNTATIDADGTIHGAVR